MQYLEQSDIESLVVYRFIDESSQDDQDVIDNVEAQNIELVKSYLKTRYDVETIFAEEPIKNPILVRVLSKLVIFDVIRRNAARKVPDDFREEYDKAMSLLEKLSTGRLPLSDVPPATAENASPSQSVWGNNKNPNFYI